MYLIKEIFGPTIQGEGSNTGLPVLFLRFAGCNRWSGKEEHKSSSICSFCDTDFVGGEKMDSFQIVEKLNSLSNTVKDVVISGGEPTLQIKKELILNLTLNRFKVHLETNGSINIDDYSIYLKHVTMSPKQALQDTELSECDDIKILFPWIHESISWESFKEFKYKEAYLQPQWGSDSKELLEEIYKSGKLKLSAQLHKYMELE